MTDPQPPRTDADLDADLDTVGHGLDRAMGLDQLSRPARTSSREQAEPELAPITKRFPSMRSDPPAPRRK